MRRTLLLGWLFMLTTAASAQALDVPDTAVAEGRFLSIPVRGQEDGPLTVEVPEGITLFGAPGVHDGRGLVNLLVSSEVAAGEHEITVRMEERPEERATTVVRVPARYGVRVRAPPGRTVVAGDQVEYVLEIINTGNTSDRYTVRVRSLLDAQLQPQEVQLPRKGAAEVTLRLDAEDRRRDTASIAVTSAHDPEVVDRAAIRTDILAFAGADELDGPSQRYRLELGASYGSDGLGFAAGARLRGDLSDFVWNDGALELVPERLRGRASLGGDDWSLGYRGTGSSHRLDASTGPWEGHASLFGEGYGVGASYENGPWRLAATHRQAATSRQTAGVGYALRPVPGLSISPSVDVVRSTPSDGDPWGAQLGVRATVQTEPVIGSARLTVPYRTREAWALAASASSRSQDPFGVRADVAVTAQRTAALVVLQQDLSDEVSLQQRLSYRGEASISLRARYRPSTVPATFVGDFQSTLRDGAFSAGGGASVQYRFPGGDIDANVGYGERPYGRVSGRYQVDVWEVSANVGFDAGLGYGASAGYVGDDFDVAARYRHAGDNHEIGAALGVDAGRWTGSVAYLYGLETFQHRAEAEIGYTTSRGHGVFATADIGDGVTWRVGGSYTLRGGFETPDHVISTFGGREVAFVEGVVFHDVNRSGDRQPGEPPIESAVVRVGSGEARSSADGRFRLAARPGEYPVRVGSLPADMGLIDTPEVSLSLGSPRSVDIPVATVVNVTGVVYDDDNRNERRDASEEPLSHVRVRLEGRDEARRTYADGSGAFFFQDLAPGTYTLSLDPDTLPDRYEPTTSGTSFELEPGPTRRVEMGAFARPREVDQTLSVGDLTVAARVEPNSAPPGADVRVIATTQGEPDAVRVHTADDSEAIALDPTGADRSFAGYVTIPPDAQGLVTLEVRAFRGSETVQQPLFVTVRSGPMARVRVVPSFLEAGEEASVDATFLTRVKQAFVTIDGTQHDLQREATYTFKGSITAPDEAGSYEVELWADGERFASTRFRVSE